MLKYTQNRGQSILSPDLQKIASTAKSRPGRAERVAENLALLQGPSKPVKRKKKPAPTDEQLVHTLEVTRPLLDPLEQAKKLRSKCRETGFLLKNRGLLGSPLHKAGAKILNCSIWGLYQSLSQSVNYKIGTALCKNRLCPNCQRVLAAKRRSNFLDWFELNKTKLRKYFFYHMVLTVRHSHAEGVRTNLYTPDLLRYFAELRGTSADLAGSLKRERAARWKEFVAGGSYSVEIKQGRDGSPHIHMHVLLVGKKQLWNARQKSVFIKYIQPLWREITGDSEGLFVDPVYYIDPQTKERHNCHLGSNLYIAQAVAECEKYTIKADAQDLSDYSDAFLTDLLTFRNRYYARFGCLSANDKSSKQFVKLDMLCTDYKDLEQVERDEVARLFNPETAEMVPAEATSITARPVRFTKPKPPLVPVEQLATHQHGDRVLGGLPYYSLLPMPLTIPSVWLPYHARQQAAIVLGRSVRDDYNPDLDLSSNS